VVGGSGAECTAISLENSHTSWLSVQVFREFSESWELESVYVGMGIGDGDVARRIHVPGF